MSEGRAVTVLAVDDTEANRYAVARVLRHQGYEVLEAETGREGLRVARERQPDLILLDVHLPDLNGFDVCRELKADPRTDAIPVIQISASFTDPESRARGLVGGADAYLTHPLEPTVLAATVTAMLRTRRAEQEARRANERAQQARAEAERLRDRLADVLDRTTDAFMMMDAGFCLTYVNREAARLIRAPVEALLGRTHWEVWPGSEGSAVEQVYREVLRAQHPVQFIHHYVAEAEGADRWVELHVYPAPEGLSVFARDAAPLRAAYLAVRRGLEEFRSIVTQVDLGVVHLSAAGEFLMVNDHYARMFGYAPAELVGRGIRDVVDGAADERVARTLASVVAGESRTVETTGRRRDGSTLLLSVTLSPLRTAEAVTVVGVAADITERRREEEALRETQRLESIGVLAGGIAHDFNNLLTGVMGNVSLALRGLPPETAERTAPMLEDALRATERAAELTRQLLAYAGKGRVHVRPVDLCRLIQDTAGLLRMTVPRQVTIALELGGGCPEVEADASQLQQLVMNLVVNAAEAFEERTGTVTVRTRDVQLDAATLAERYRAPDLAPGRYLELEVIDRGIGMAPETMSRIFDPFFTTKFLGRGLGLSAAQGIVRGHRGAIAVDSAPGRGSSFSVVLPASPTAALTPVPLATVAPPSEAAADAAASAARPAGETTVLVVDDEDTVRDVARLVLESEGYHVLTAEHGEEALARLEAEPDRIRLVLLDLTMPVMSGAEAAERMRAVRPDLPILVMSGYGDRDAMARFRGVAIDGFVQKPFHPDRLLQRIAKALAERHG